MSIAVEIIALHRIGFGPREGDVERVGKMGLSAYLEEQLRPDDANDPLCAQKLAAARLHIEYDAGKDDKGGEQYPACKEDRPLKCLDLPLSELWRRADDQVPHAGEERSRPLAEVKAATWVRAIFSRWQLREVLVDFWHNHFNVNMNPGDALFALVERMGQRLFSWPAPTGHPEASGYWLGTNAMLGRWNSPLALLGDSGIATFRLIRESASADTWRKLCGYWAVRLLGRPLDDRSMKTLLDFAAGGGSADERIAIGDAELVDRLHAVVALIAMTPDFQMC